MELEGPDPFPASGPLQSFAPVPTLRLTRRGAVLKCVSEVMQSVPVKSLPQKGLSGIAKSRRYHGVNEHA